MEIPDNLHALVDQLGKAIVQALVNDPHSRELARQIQDAGFDIALLLEATVALRQREDAGQPGEEPKEPDGEETGAEAGGESLRRARILPEDLSDSGGPGTLPDWSDADKAFLKTFKISLE